MNPQSHYQQAIRHERTLHPFIPYSTHPNEHTIATKEGDYLTIWRVGGLPFETCDPEQIHIPKEQLNTLLRSIGSSHVALWQHTIRRKTCTHLISDYDNAFCHDFNQRYHRRINADALYRTELYLTLIYRPAPSRTLKRLIRLSQRRLEDHIIARNQAIKALDDLAEQIDAALRPYQLRRLASYTATNGSTCSEPLSFLNTLITGH